MRLIRGHINDKSASCFEGGHYLITKRRSYFAHLNFMDGNNSSSLVVKSHYVYFAAVQMKHMLFQENTDGRECIKLH